MGTNTVSVRRIPDNTTIEAISIQINSDVDSFASTISMQVDFSGYQLLRPQVGVFREVEITINGFRTIAVIEGLQNNQAFGRSTYTVVGRTRSAYLAKPMAAGRTYTEVAARSMAQLATQELDNTPWSLAWNTVDWVVPAGVWSYQELSPIEAIARLAAAAGAVVLVDPAEYQITVEPRYPLSPSQWGTTSPDLILTALVGTQFAETWQSRPEYNAVVVSGESQGVIVNASRSGSAGDFPAPMIVDPLITSELGGVELARNVLADTGRQSVTRVQVPLFAEQEPGYIAPNTFIEMVDDIGDTYRGIVRTAGVSVLSNEQGLSVFQSIEVERHHG